MILLSLSLLILLISVNDVRSALSDSNPIKLSESVDCQEDFEKYCPNLMKKDNLSPYKQISILKCIHDKVSDFSVINERCQHTIYLAKKDIAMKIKLNDDKKTCESDIEQLDVCKTIQDSDGQLVSCLLDNINNLKSTDCRSYVKNLAFLISTDHRLVYKFLEDCGDDIAKYKCGRLEEEKGENLIPQGKTIVCLSLHIRLLQRKCLTQIKRVSELQSNDYHMDRTLYFACRDDRENLCERIVAGEGRVYECLMKKKFDPIMSGKCREELVRRQKINIDAVDVDTSLINICRSDLMKTNCRDKINSQTENVGSKIILECLEALIHDGIFLSLLNLKL
jgi:golgi apparatus protein 1